MKNYKRKVRHMKATGFTVVGVGVSLVGFDSMGDELVTDSIVI